MAMNKKEAAEFANLRRDLALAKALRWPDTPVPERLPLPDVNGAWVQGWDFNEYTGIVEQAWTERHAHGRGVLDVEERRRSIRGSQNGRRVFATRLDALIALRHAQTREFAKRLAGLDVLIEEARGREVKN